MKKILLATCVLALALGTKTYATETYTGGLVDSLNQKINKTTSPIICKEKELKEKQKAAQELKQKQIDAQKAQIESKQKAQQELVNRKKQQIKTQKELFQQQKNEVKDLFKLGN